VSRKARELELMMMLLVTLIMMAVVEDNMLICCSFVKIRIFDADFGLQSRIVGVALVELIDKRSILCLETTTNR